VALQQATLKQAILDLLDNISTSPDAATRRAAAAAAWADAFDTYAGGVKNANEDSALSGPNKAGFAAALSFTATTAAQTAQEFGAAWTAYFTGLTFTPGVPGPINAAECPNIGGNLIFGIIISSSVTVVNAAPLIAQLTTHFTTFRGTDRDVAADTLAGIFHSNTVLLANLTVLTSGTDTTPPAAGPLPITNTCRVF
jgi:hypothetical protein